MFRSTIYSTKIAQRNSVKVFESFERLIGNHHHFPVLSQDAQISKAKKDDSRDFTTVWPNITQDFSDFAKKYDRHDANEWMIKILEYNVPHGKKNRGGVLVESFQNFARNDEASKENLELAKILGWCVEMAVFVIYDDIMDGSTTRRGRKCWYQLNDVGLNAVNDALMLENGIYYILKKNFGNKHYYKEIFELFHEVTLISTVGQFQDTKMPSNDFEAFTMDRYKTIVINKTAYYSFYLPVALAMHMANYKDPKLFHEVKKILLEIGTVFQVQDDYIDCFGDPKITGKIGTDIQDRKCSWLAVVALQICNEKQREIMKKCYGQNDPEKVEFIKLLYKELDLPRLYEIYEEDSYKKITSQIQNLSPDLPRELFHKILERFYKRKM